MQVWHGHRGAESLKEQPPRGLGAQEPSLGKHRQGRQSALEGVPSEKGVTEGPPDTNMKKGKETPSKVQWV